MTGRSGGGIYSWWVAALDDRIQVAVPVAGITTLHNYVVDGCVEGHCDCMFMVNTYRWDYPQVAALVAPRPLLISNSDKDRIFPLDGVVELHRQVRDVYRLYDAEDKLGLQITEGPHQDTQNLRVHAFNWFNRFLKDDNAPIRTVADKVLQPSELKVFDLLPEDETVTTIDETFVAAADARSMPDSKVDLESQADRWLETLHKKTFAAWPEEAMTETDVRLDSHVEHDNIVRSRYTFDSGPVYRLPFYLLESVNGSQPSTRNRVEVLDQSDWDQLASALTAEAPGRAEWQHLEDRLSASTADKLILFPPRGVGPTEWTRDPVERRHLRRRFLLLGQTDDAMRIWDVRRLLVALRTPQLFADNPIELAGERDAAAWALYASLFAGGVDSLELTDLPSTHREGISLLNVSRFLEMPQVVQMAMVSNGKTKLIGSAESIAAWQPIVNASLVDKARLSLSTKENRQ